MYILTLSLTEHWHRLHLETRLAQPVQQTRCPHGTNTTPMSASRQILHVLAAFRRLFSTSMSHGNLSRQPLPANAAVTVVSQNSHRKNNNFPFPLDHQPIFQAYSTLKQYPSVLWHCWLGDRNGISLSFSGLTAIFQVNLGQPVPTEAKDDGGSSDNWTTGAISRAKLQPNDHHQQTNIQFFYSPDALPVAQPTVSKHWREKYHTPWTCLPQTHLGVFQLCLWHTNSSRLPWGGLPCLSSALWRQYPILPVKICSSNPQRQRTSQWPAVLQKCG